MIFRLAHSAGDPPSPRTAKGGWTRCRVVAVCALAIAFLGTGESGARAEERPIHIGLDGDFSGATPESGLAIERGMKLAADEVNAAGGVLGRPVRIVSKDDRGVPARGVDNLRDFLAIEDLVAVVGGLYSPVVLAQIPVAQENGIVLISAWAAATGITKGDAGPGYVFRLSVRDDMAGEFLVSSAKRRGFHRLGLLLWRSAWGTSNEAAMTASAKTQGLEVAGTQWFNVGERNLSAQVDSLMADGADVIMLVAGPKEGMSAVKAMAQRPPEAQLPFISHWGITGTDFHALGSYALERVDLTVLQTFSFFDPPFPEKAREVLAAYCASYGACSSPADIVSPVGTAHGYDIVQLVARAVEKAGTVDRSAVRSALERLDRYDGLVRVYDPAFTPADHDALSGDDYILARFDAEGAIVPAALGH